MINSFLPAYRLDDHRRLVLVGLTFEETKEFHMLDARLPYDGQPAWPTDGLPRLPMEQRWLELWTKHQASLSLICAISR